MLHTHSPKPQPKLLKYPHTEKLMRALKRRDLDNGKIHRNKKHMLVEIHFFTEGLKDRVSGNLHISHSSLQTVPCNPLQGLFPVPRMSSHVTSVSMECLFSRRLEERPCLTACGTAPWPRPRPPARCLSLYTALSLQCSFPPSSFLDFAFSLPAFFLSLLSPLLGFKLHRETLPVCLLLYPQC